MDYRDLLQAVLICNAEQWPVHIWTATPWKIAVSDRMVSVFYSGEKFKEEGNSNANKALQTCYI